MRCVVIAVFFLAGCSAADLKRGLDTLREQPISETEVAAGLKEALAQGTAQASESLSRFGAYLDDSGLRIAFPPSALRVEQALRKVGLGRLADDVVAHLNHAAEDAAGRAKPIFLEVIRTMTIGDAMRLLRGGHTDATEYLRDRAGKRLVTAYLPVVRDSLDQSGATHYWKEAMEAYNRIPLVEKVETDLPGYVTARAVDGLFRVIGDEERRIRRDPAARTTELLRRVFGRNPIAAE